MHCKFIETKHYNIRIILEIAYGTIYFILNSLIFYYDTLW